MYFIWVFFWKHLSLPSVVSSESKIYMPTTLFGYLRMSGGGSVVVAVVVLVGFVVLMVGVVVVEVEVVVGALGSAVVVV